MSQRESLLLSLCLLSTSPTLHAALLLLQKPSCSSSRNHVFSNIFCHLPARDQHLHHKYLRIIRFLVRPLEIIAFGKTINLHTRGLKCVSGCWWRGMARTECSEAVQASGGHIRKTISLGMWVCDFDVASCLLHIHLAAVRLNPGMWSVRYLHWRWLAGWWYNGGTGNGIRQSSSSSSSSSYEAQTTQRGG